MGLTRKSSLALYAIAMLAAALLGAILTFALLRGAGELLVGMTAALASILVAVATFVLAAHTSASVAATKGILENQASNFCKSQTIALANQYFQVPVQVDANTVIAPYNAHCDLMIFSQRIGDVIDLKACYEREPESKMDLTKRRQYRSLVGSIPLLLNFYSFAAQQYAEGVLDKRMFLDGFAGSFVSLWRAIAEINKIVEAVPGGKLGQLSDFKAVCEKWINDRSATSASAAQVARERTQVEGD